MNKSGENQMPTDEKSLTDRGVWLAIAFVRASGGDLKLLLQSLDRVDLTKETRSKARLEMTIFSLSQSEGILKSCILEKLLGSTSIDPDRASEVIIEGAWEILGTLFPKEKSIINGARKLYSEATDRAAILWGRLKDQNLPIADSNPHLAVFQKTVLQGTVTALTLDAVTIAQVQINDAHDSFFR